MLALKAILKYIATFFIVFLILFNLQRAVFLWYQKAFTWLDFGNTMVYGLQLDVSILCYFIVLPILFLTLSSWRPGNYRYTVLKVYHLLISAFFALVHIIDLELFKEWGSKINAQFYVYLETPKEALASSGSAPITLLILIGLANVLLIYLAHNRFMSFLKTTNHRLKWLHIPVIILLIGLAFLGIRGGVGTIPNNQSVAYYSTNNTLNNAALNSVWNSFYFLFNGKNLSYASFNYYTEKEVNAFHNHLQKTKAKGKTILIDSKQQPNVVLVVLESWAADVVSSLESKENLTPNFDALAAKGLLYTECYSTGVRTDKGISAVLSGFPAQSDASAIMFPEKSLRMPSILKEFKDYSSLFVYGGDPSFANMKIYIQNMGFQEIKDKTHFSKAEQNSKWGAHDGVVLSKSIEWMNAKQQPFFSTILTLSSHEPFEVPMDQKYPGNKNTDKFKNSIIYSDQALGEFMKQCAKQDWFENTVFLFVADHGRETGVEYPVKFHPGFYKIPLMVFSPLLSKEYMGLRDSQLVSQTDVPALLLDIFEISNPSQYLYSSSPLDSIKRKYVYFAYYDGVGVYDKKNANYYDNISQKDYCIQGMDSTKTRNSELTYKAKLYQQTVMRDYFNLSKTK